MKPGTLKATKAIGWFIDEYQIAQVSMNITNISVTPLHVAFDEVCRAANARGVRVTGTEIVGLIPKRTLIEAGRYFLKKQERSTGISEEEIIRIAIKSMGLDELKPFKPEEKVIEYLIEADNKKKKLVDLTCTGFAEETASESPGSGRRFDFRLHGCAGRCPGYDGRQPVVAQTRLGRTLGGVLRLGGQRPEADDRVAAPGR